MSVREKAQSVIILAAVLIGLALGNVPVLAQHAGRFILPLLMLMLLGVFLQVPLQGLVGAMQHRRVAIASVIINFSWTPLLAWLLGWLFLGDHPALWVGFLMLMVTPCTDWYLVFTGIARGNVALSTALLPINLVLQLLLLPLYILVLAGTIFPLDGSLILESVLLVLVIPFLLAHGLRQTIMRAKGKAWLGRTLLPRIEPAQLALLALAIVAVFASEGEAVAQNPQLLLNLLPPLALFFAGNLGLAFVVSRWLNSSYENFVTLSYTVLARNSPIALAIALVAFPEEPLVALALVVGPLIELPVLALIAQVLLWIQRRGVFASAPDRSPRRLGKR